LTRSKCPVAHDFRFTGAGEAMNGFVRYDDLQDRHRIVRVEEPEGAYYVLLDRDLIVAGLQDTETFSSNAITPLQPDPLYSVIPIMLDPPEHTKWRRLLSGYFAVRRLPLLDARIRERCTQLLDGFEQDGACDYASDFAFRFPTTIFLEIMGLPPDELDTLLEWERAILYPGPDGSIDPERRIAAVLKVFDRFRELIAERRAAPARDADDIVSHAASWEIDGVPVSDDQILSCCLLLFIAGLDTVANELSFATHHLATHPADRAWLAEEPTRSVQATEELLRTFAIGQIARKVRREAEVDGVRLNAGDMVLFPLAAANRDPAHLDRPREVDFARELEPHYTFGAGPHRCLGSHLARREVAVALELWHKRIPEYELATDEPLPGHWGSVHGLTSLPLRWPTADAASGRATQRL
jgi:cytochrome P450